MKIPAITALLFAFVFPAALRADTLDLTFPIAGAHMNLLLPQGWARMPDEALAKFHLGGQDSKAAYLAGFAGPHQEGTPGAFVLVHVYPANTTPEDFLGALRAAHQKMEVQALGTGEGPPAQYFVDKSLGVVVLPGPSRAGLTGRFYTIPTTSGLIGLDLYCPSATAPVASKHFEVLLSKSSLTDGVKPDKDWLERLITAGK